MDVFGLGPCKQVGIIKTAIREAILEGEIHSNYAEAYQLMLLEGAKLGLKLVKQDINSPLENLPPGIEKP